MASAKLTVALAAAAVMCAALAATTTLADPGEDCGVQNKYFVNCLGRGIMEGCCGVVSDRRCFCLLEREAEIHCVPGRGCPKPHGAAAKAVKLAELDLSCMRNLKCKRA